MKARNELWMIVSLLAVMGCYGCDDGLDSEKLDCSNNGSGCTKGYICQEKDGEFMCLPDNCVTLGCQGDKVCNDDTGECEMPAAEGQSCSKGELKCKEDERCNQTTGNCYKVDSCLTNGCQDGYTCNKTSGQCEKDDTPAKTCKETGCESGFACNEATGRCEQDADDSTLTCKYTDGSGSKIVLKGKVLTADAIIEGGIVVVDGQTIAYVGKEADVDVDISDAKIIDCTGSVISAGLINAHDHITYTNQRPGDWGEERFAHRNEWRLKDNGHTCHNAASTKNNEVGEMRQLMSGSTAIFGSGSVKGLMRNIDKEKIGNVTVTYQTFPLGSSKTLSSGCKYDYATSEGQFGPHIGEGINAGALNELVCLSSDENGGRNIFNDKLAIIHGVAATPDIISAMAAADSKLIWSPRTNISLYGDTAIAPLYDDLGVTIALGTDWTASGSINLLRELQCVDNLNKHYYDNHFTDKQLWEMVTINGAKAFGLQNSIGDLKKGMLADIAIFQETETNKDYRAVIDAKPQNVQLVMVGGKIGFADKNLVKSSNCEEVNVCGTMKKACPKDVGSDKTWSAIRNATLNAEDVPYNNKDRKDELINAKYDLFFCDVPEDEPTCTPLRTRPADTSSLNSTVYEGDYSDPNDQDGDGIPNDKDNCPNIFNPIRPQDNGFQSDIDEDGIGDVCDPYPFCKQNDASCPKFDPNDRDGDGIPNATDNCPMDANPDQLDSDDDKKGDVCDECPNDANPGDLRCPLKTQNTIQEVNDIIDDRCDASGNCVVGEQEVLTEGEVTNITTKGFFIQDANASELARSGLYIYVGTLPNDIKVGDIVSVQGYATSYNGLTQLGTPQYSVTGESEKRIAPKAIPATATNLRDYIGTLVAVNGATITQETKDEKENIIYPIATFGSDTLNLASFYYATWNLKDAKNQVAIGNSYASVAGIVVIDQKAYKLSPRDNNDLVEGIAISDVVASKNYVAVNETFELTITANADVPEDMNLESISSKAVSCSATKIEAGKHEATMNCEVVVHDLGPANITVKYGDAEYPVTVIVYDPDEPVSVAAITTDYENVSGKITVPAAEEFEAIITLSRPDPENDTTVEFLSDDENIVSVPANVVIPKGETEAEVTMTIQTEEAGKSAKVTAKIGEGAAYEMEIVTSEPRPSFSITRSVDIAGSTLTGSGYTCLYKQENVDSSQTTVTALGNCDKSRPGISINSNKLSTGVGVTIAPVSGVGVVTVQYAGWVKNGTEGQINVTVSDGNPDNDQTKNFKVSGNDASDVKTVDLEFNMSKATSILIAAPNVDTDDNAINRVTIKGVKWTTNK